MLVAPTSILEQFHKENGKCVLGLDGRTVYFINGARRENDAMGRLWELSDLTLYEQLENKVGYYEVWLEKAEEQFRTMRKNFSEEIAIAARDGWGTSTSPEHVGEQLGEAQKLVRDIRAIIRKLEKQMAATPQGRAAAEREERRASLQAEAERQRSQIMRVVNRFRI